MRTSLSLLFALSLLALLTGASGCTLIGYAIGSGVDASNTEFVELPPGTAIDRLEATQPMTCMMRDGTSHTGRYAGIGMPTREELLNRLPAEPEAGCTERATVRFGDELVLHRPGLAPEPVRYLGTSAQRLWYAPLDRSEVRILLFQQITELTRCDGQALKPPFEKLVDGGIFESSNCLRLVTPEVLQHLSITDIRAISFRHTRTSKRTTYTVIGLAADVAIFAGVLAATGPDSGGGGGGGIGPLIGLLEWMNGGRR